MRWLIAMLLPVAAPAVAQTLPVAPVQGTAAPLLAIPRFTNPVAAYVTPGQDEPGYRSWYLSTPGRAIAVASFNSYLNEYGVGGVVPTWQLLRTASSWQRCAAQPFEVPPTSEWPHLVQTLRYVRDYVVPAVGPVEPVSAYRNPVLNACAGGAPESAHKHYSAVDLVPLRATTREDLMQTLCTLHARRGTDYAVGLGFYAYLRFHVDTTKYRRWGADSASVDCPPIIRPEDVATVGPPLLPQPTAVLQPLTGPPPTPQPVPQSQ